MNDKYLTYDALELAQDDAFIRWVKGGDGLLWEQWAGLHPEKQQTVKEARLLVQAITIKEAPVSQTRIDKLWNKIDASSGEAQALSKKPRLKAYRWLSYAAAAALALVFAFFFLQPDGAVRIETAYGQITEHVLPDGSMVRLNAGTAISYNKATWPKARQVSLEGEAFFEVKKGEAFTVKTPQGKVAVLGTSFNINTFEGQFDVHCYTGKVRVSAGEQQEGLSAGQQARWQGQSWQKAPFEANNSPGWQNGRLEYHNRPLQEVFAEMERQFDIRIDAPDSILARTYTGAYERNELDSALYRVCWPMKLEASQKGKVVVIRPVEISGE